MRRSARLLDLIQALRRRRRPVAAAVLAGELGVSLRTLYRDIATLVEGGAPIVGAAGLGYVLEPGYFLPPLMFRADEVDALVLGLRLVEARGDPDLATAAADALAKILAVLPPALEDADTASGLLAAPGKTCPHLPALRTALRREDKLRLSYVDKNGTASSRVVWPVAVGFFEATEVLAAWCETRADFRHFRLDRIRLVELLDERLPKRRRVLLAEWRLSQDLDR